MQPESSVSYPEPKLKSLYQQLILEHYRKPRNKAELEDRTVEVHMANPVCGDEIRLQLRIEDDEIAEAKFVGQGCSISQASVSMMTGLLKGKKLSEADALAERFTEMMHGDDEAASDRSLGDLRALQGVSKFPVRIKCALLGFDALQEALEETRGAEGAGSGAR
ncbi:MAG: SUF system NifU family Fe-S cluster assembly protein [Gemmatimonadetes bacterium]|nr:SUF system NifU family Fe-S cluster assembly protein [Gemmatimonadota bacterium]NIR77328.1 SUF system NifU family Fe-S cluster assembly protein [Gemmatimonadota bacterium]NIT85854.1 SUF system NifU family Fe-S cluster assembly protein [Gemmatimonadota bacterium]NIU29676.1 SUF system NifU family Fe-S cluster assembly protein [Gemmatimonadota bacterium]NIU34720.1 SUF system NifU family Fe-S cluster assembly protein [Gemmatimonadota bacterium]